ncbi:hypothetical protein [Microseira wollei]|nr:hypothetical protein [Microseira wollei]
MGAIQDRCRDTAVEKFSLRTKVTDAVSLPAVDLCARGFIGVWG